MKSVYIDTLRSLEVGEQKPYELYERRKIASCVSKYFHQSTLIRFKLKQNKALKIVTVIRLENAKVLKTKPNK